MSNNRFQGLLKDIFENTDENKILINLAKLEQNILDEKLLFISTTTPKEYIAADIKKINQYILTSNKRFVWLTGCYGSGKTYSLYAIRNNEIIKKNNYYFEVKLESEIEYGLNIKHINAIDNLTINESKLKFLNEFYSQIINYCYSEHKKLFLASTIMPNIWLKEMHKYSFENGEAIASRFSNNLDIIDLGNIDRRRHE